MALPALAFFFSRQWCTHTAWRHWVSYFLCLQLDYTTVIQHIAKTQMLDCILRPYHSQNRDSSFILEVHREATLDWTYCLSPAPLHPAGTCCLLQSFRSVILHDFEIFPWSPRAATSPLIFPCQQPVLFIQRNIMISIAISNTVRKLLWNSVQLEAIICTNSLPKSLPIFKL